METWNGWKEWKGNGACQYTQRGFKDLPFGGIAGPYGAINNISL